MDDPMSASSSRLQRLVLAFLAALVLAACGGGGGGGGSSTPTDPDPPGPDRSGTWTLRVSPTNPCAGDPTSFTISADLVQNGRTLTGSGCDGGNAATVTLTLSGANNTHFTGNLNGCQSVNHDCQAPYVSGSCLQIPVQGDITGSTVSGTYSVSPFFCNGQGTFTGTIS
jgi:hypothetical protein